MNVAELRLGNIVKSLNHTVDYLFIKNIFEHQVVGFRNNYDGNSINSFSIEMLNIEPIPLTVEWLEIFGFKDNRFMLPGDGELEIRLLGSTFHIWPSDGQTEGHNYRNHVNYVHQLQNLYFALTGEELTTK